MRAYAVTNREYRAIVIAPTAGAAKRWARRRYGSVLDPYEAHSASVEELQNQLKAGAVFHLSEGGILEKEAAFNMAGLTPISVTMPSKTRRYRVKVKDGAIRSQ